MLARAFDRQSNCSLHAVVLPLGPVEAEWARIVARRRHEVDASGALDVEETASRAHQPPLLLWTKGNVEPPGLASPAHRDRALGALYRRDRASLLSGPGRTAKVEPQDGATSPARHSGAAIADGPAP